MIHKLAQLPFFLHVFAVFSAGAFLSFAQAPYSFWPLIFPCLGLFYILLAYANNKRQAFLLGFCFTFGYFLFGLLWIGNALLVEGNAYRWAWPLAVVALPMGLSLFAALATTLIYMFGHLKSLRGFIVFCMGLALAEWARGYAFTGFPWNLYGYVWGDFLEIAQISSIIGPYGLTFLTIIMGAIFGFVFIASDRGQKIIAGAISIGLFVSLLAYGTVRFSEETAFHPDISVHLVQPNIDQADKWKSDKFVQNFEKHLALSRAEGPHKNIIIWAETALPPVFLKNPSVNQRIQFLLGKDDILLAGGLDISFEPVTESPRYHNALMGWRKNASSARLYSKSHLVPFGEYIPFQQYIPLPTVTQFSGFEKGNGNETIQWGNTPAFSPLICYEIIFPHQIVNKGQPRPDYLLTVTNDGWYGDSAGPYQHFNIAKFRAIEQGLPVIRVANTGISGVIDANGRVIQKTEILEIAAVTQPLPKAGSKTFFSQYGDIPFLLFIMGLSVMVCVRKNTTFD